MSKNLVLWQFSSCHGTSCQETNWRSVGKSGCLWRKRCKWPRLVFLSGIRWLKGTSHNYCLVGLAIPESCFKNSLAEPSSSEERIEIYWQTRMCDNFKIRRIILPLIEYLFSKWTKFKISCWWNFKLKIKEIEFFEFL